MSSVIEVRARARLITDGPLTRPVRVGLRYDPADGSPTVHLTPPDGPDWAVARELLDHGLRTPIERGPVHVWPCGRTQVIVELHTAEGVEVFQFEKGTLNRFLARTHAQPVARPVPPDAGRRRGSPSDRGAQPAHG